MISMQRSLSSPVCVHSSPPVSPSSIHQLDSGSPSHSSTKPRPYPSRNPTELAEEPNTLPLRRYEDAGGRADHSRRQQSTGTSQQPVVAHTYKSSFKQAELGSDESPGLPQDTGALPYSTSLLQDDVSGYRQSLYNNSFSTTDGENTTLEELAHLVRLAKYQERKRANTRIRLQRTLVSTALNARLIRCGDVAHRNLVDSFRRDDKDGFAALYNALHDIRKSCDEVRRYALLEPDMEPAAAALGSSENLASPPKSEPAAGTLQFMTPFFQELSASARSTFLDFLGQLRTDPDYLATRICSLTSAELNAFLTFHKGLEPVESVLPFHGRSTTRSHPGTSTRGGGTAVDIERLLSFQRHDPLSILIHTCFANSAGPDSSEDQRRLNIWATALARLISEPKSSGENFLISVLNVWTTMRDWSGKSNMEWYLMKILENGAFLLDRAEDQHGTRFNLSDWNQSDEMAAKAFYDTAVNELFEMVDDDDATGIPDGLLELGNAILKRLDHKLVENTSRWLVWRCLFFVFLLGVIVHPESYGMLVEYHITPYAREKILKTVAMKAHEYVSTMWSGKPSATCVPMDIPSKIKGHVESILARFQGSRSKVPAAKLLPARSVTSLRETAEVHPYLVVSPAELVALVNALFPERRPHSAASSGLRSGPASISGMSAISQPINMLNTRPTIETASIISTSASSAFSEANTSREGFIDDLNSTTPQRYTPPSIDPEALRKLNKYEDDGYRLRLAVHEMSQTFGTDAVRGHCHPCAERWAVLFISSDGKSLSTQMTYDPDEEGEEDDHSSSAETDEDDEVDCPELDKDYHQLRDAILRLVEDFEIPRSLEKEKVNAQFSNRASRLKKYRSKNRIIMPEKSASGRHRYKSSSGNDPPATRSYSHAPNWPPRAIPVEVDPYSEPVLVTMLKAASAQSKSQADFISAHVYWKTLNHLNELESPSLRQNGFEALINIFSRGPRDSIRLSASAIEEYDAWLVWLKQSQERHDGLLERMMRRVRAIRDKMWYVTDVRNSKEYAHTRDICQALKTMGMPRRWSSFQRSRGPIGRGSGASYLYRTESQIIDLLAASEEQGGPNKLSDDQAETTSSWLRQKGVENFCRGEERIHRFCCELDRCLSKLIGETIRDAPVLWSSELYRRDKIVFDRMKAQEREHSSNPDDGSSVVSDNERKFANVSGRPSAFTRDLRSMSGHNTSQQSVESARHSYARLNAPLADILDGQEYFDRSSPVHNADATSTFWSPFQPAMSPDSSLSRAYSPTTSLTNLSTTFSGPLHHQTLPSNSSVSTGRPGTSASSNETIYQHRSEDRRLRFLDDLKQSLTSLLLSDLGNSVLARGSETDDWFRTLGQECIDRKDALDRRARRRSEKKEGAGNGRRSSTRPRVIEKKKSFGNLRGAGDASSDRGEPTEQEQHTRASATPTMSSEASSRHGSLSKPPSTEFPFKKAYQRLLTMFCVQPNPYAKLNALYELENLIVASLSASGHRRSRWNRSEEGSSTAEEYGADHRPTPLEGTIDNVRERRTQALHNSIFSASSGQVPRQVGGGGSGGTRSTLSGGSVNTDAITSELQNLFRDASIRPKSLFRDLQLIASFVPPSVLDKAEKGKAFWNTGMAALKLKAEVCRTMVETADEVVAASTHARKAAPSNNSSSPAAVAAGPFQPSTPRPGSQPSSSGTPPPAAVSYSLEDAGKMWAITAKEGFPTAQRELALFYLANPERVERTTLPLFKPREVFKQAVMDMYGRNERGKSSSDRSGGGANGQGVVGLGGAGGIESGGDNYHHHRGGGASLGPSEGDVRSDPGLMCVAIHWMEAAEQGGDELATTFLRQNEFKGLN